MAVYFHTFFPRLCHMGHQCQPLQPRDSTLSLSVIMTGELMPALTQPQSAIIFYSFPYTYHEFFIIIICSLRMSFILDNLILNTEHLNLHMEHLNLHTEHQNLHTEHPNQPMARQNRHMAHQNLHMEHQNLPMERLHPTTTHLNPPTEPQNQSTKPRLQFTLHRRPNTEHPLRDTARRRPQ